VPSSTGRGTRVLAIVAVFVLVVPAIWALGNAGRGGTTASGEPLVVSPSTVGRTAAATAATGSSSPAGSSLPSGGTPDASAVLVGAGDIASCSSSGDEATADLLDTIAGTVFTLGDNVYENGAAAEFKDCYGPTWGRQRDRTLPVPGNHDYNTPGATGYFGYFGTAAGDPSTGYYATDLGTWRVYVVNSNCAAIGGCDAGSAQERWLRDDLAANPRACVLAMWHHPRFSSGEHGNDAATQALWQALYAAGAELVLNGHDHDYERFAPQTPTGTSNPSRGIVEIVAGTGGRSRYPFFRIRANSVVRDNTTYGVLRLVLSEAAWSSEFIAVPGGTFSDSSSGTCH
jgi:hypothetical protein